jgi:hypothetical protein
MMKEDAVDDIPQWKRDACMKAGVDDAADGHWKVLANLRGARMTIGFEREVATSHDPDARGVEAVRPGHG